MPEGPGIKVYWLIAIATASRPTVAVFGWHALNDAHRRRCRVATYAPVRLFLAEKDEATSPVLCGQMAESKRSIPVKTVLWKGANHSFEDHEPIHMFHGYHIGYNAAAAEGTIKAIISALNATNEAEK